MAAYAHPEAIVSTEWLAANLGDLTLRLFDCTTYLLYETGTGRPYRIESGRADYDAGHIPGAGFLDLQAELSDRTSRFNFTMPTPDDLAARLAACGIGDGTRVVLYSRKTPQWATRVWWMMRAIGFDNAAILDGGIDAWMAEGRAISTTETRYAPATLHAKPRPGLFVGRDEMLAAIGDGGTCSINALAPDLHSGANPRYGRPGRIPGSVNLPAASLFEAGSFKLKAPDQVAAAFAAIGADKG
ncbi:MAG: sulfurtransferase [Acetobacteraceae bacterium]|nr:sulfurtransferase [Acetobacteraceae bacterium]